MWIFIMVMLITQTRSGRSLDADDHNFLLQTENLPADLNFMPTLSNGHLGYTIYGDSIFMNGIYNGNAGDSRRARIPNWLNVSVSVLQQQHQHEATPLRADNTFYEMNLGAGSFRSQEFYTGVGLHLQQRSYAHRFFNRALVYELFVQRTAAATATVHLILKLTHTPGNPSSAFDFTPTNCVKASDCFKMLKGVTKIVEQADFQAAPRTIYVVFSDGDIEKREKTLVLPAGQHGLYYRFIVTADEVASVAQKEMHDILNETPPEMYQKHAAEWQQFWQQFEIAVEGNLELAQTINAGIFYLANSLPSLHTNQPNREYFGLSPTGLGRGNLDNDYEGHNFWDTEIWMLPSVTQLSTEWARTLLQYRFQHLEGAQYNALYTGYKGARFPWESAYTGTEVTNPCCPEVAQQEVHISADIAFALRQFYGTTNDREWLKAVAWPLVREIAIFLESRVTYKAETNSYHIEAVMGPDEDHENVTDNVYTNVVFKLALEFAVFTQKQCAPSDAAIAVNWSTIAQHLVILYDAKDNYHPQHLGYKRNAQVKQADVVLLGYPLQWPMNTSTRLNDLELYEHVTRATGPAMTWSIFALNFLDVNETAKADFYFEKGYSDYIWPEFKVWSETKRGSEGSANFLTGIGGFLQAIINGYAGIRFRIEDLKSIMEIRKVHLLPSCTSMSIKGIKFANAIFALEITKTAKALLTCLEIGDTKLILDKGGQMYTIFKGFATELGNETVLLQTT